MKNVMRRDPLLLQSDVLAEVTKWLEHKGFLFDTDPVGLLPYCSQEPEAYGMHIVYYQIASRGNFRVCAGKHGRITLMLPPATLKLRTRRPVIVVLRPIVHDSHAFWLMLRELSMDLGVAVVLKNVSNSDAEAATRIGFRGYMDDEGWSTIAQQDDQSFPDVVLDISSPGLISKHQSSINVSFSEVNAIDVWPLALELFNRWYDWFVSRYPTWGDWGILDFYRNSFDLSVVRKFNFSFIGQANGDITAFCAGSYINKVQCDLWICVTAEHPKGMSRVFYRWVSQRLFERGVRYLGLGGSEQAGLHWFKSHLGPHRLLSRRHLVITD